MLQNHANLVPWIPSNFLPVTDLTFNNTLELLNLSIDRSGLYMFQLRSMNISYLVIVYIRA